MSGDTPFQDEEKLWQASNNTTNKRGVTDIDLRIPVTDYIRPTPSMYTCATEQVGPTWARALDSSRLM
jgi:hypothetical protein